MKMFQCAAVDYGLSVYELSSIRRTSQLMRFVIIKMGALWEVWIQKICLSGFIQFFNEFFYLETMDPGEVFYLTRYFSAMPGSIIPKECLLGLFGKYGSTHSNMDS